MSRDDMYFRNNIGPYAKESTDDTARAAIERANGGPVFVGADHSTNFLDEQAARRIRNKLAGDIHNTGQVARFVSLRQSASETPIEFVRRIVDAYLAELVDE